MIKFTLRFIKHLAILLFVTIPLQVIGAVVLLPVCYLNRQNRLPSALKWFDNADLLVGRDPVTYLNVVASGWWPRYCWLAWRNPINYFGYSVLGAVGSTEHLAETWGDSRVGDGGLPGLYVCEWGPIYEYYFVYKWSDTKCLRFRMGWKIGNPTPGEHIQYVFAIQPYKSYWGA